MTKSPKKRCAVVGIGNRAHSWIGGIVEQHPESSELVGLCDLQLERCQDVNEAYGTQAACYTDYDQMLAEVEPDLVIVVTPERYHREHIVKALDAGCDVATEKPLCTTIEDAQAIIDAENRNNRNIFMAFNYRHIPLCSKIRELTLDGSIGTPVSMDLTWYLDYHGHGASYFRRWHRLMKESGGLLITKACHHFDLANWWMNDTPRTVFAFGERHFFGPGHNPYIGERCSTCPHADKCEWYTDVCVTDRTEELSRELGYRVKGVRGYIRDYCPFRDDVDIYDTMSVNVRYKNGGLLTYSLNASVPFEGWNLAVNGTKGRLESKITDNKPSPGWQERHQIVGPDGELLKGKGYRITDWPSDYRIHVMPHDADDYEVKLPNIAEGHGGGDFKIFDAALADIYPETDDLDIFASAIHGAWSTAIGAAANHAIASGDPVEIPDFQ
ncbi:MAG: Gfo/Idh/MocA family oxidoreductase [Kiritimatiellales bacterium]|nr:Gfo/Idh/MocA family oxidoreductase [Kiritimatiellales bacterium]